MLNGITHSAEKTARKFMSTVSHTIDGIDTKRLRKRALRATDRVADTVKDHPVATILIGLGAGYLVMRLLRK